MTSPPRWRAAQASWVAWLAVALGASCTFDSNGINAGDESPDASGIDATESDAGPPDAPACEPVCTDTTHISDCAGGPPIECFLGCKVIDSAADRCTEIVPSNGASSGRLPGVTAELTVAAGTTVLINTSSGAITSGATVIRAAGPGVIAGIGFTVVNKIGIVAVKSLTVDGTLGATGANALVLLSEGDVLVHGTIDVSARCRGSSDDFSCGGPGGFNGSTVDGFAGGCSSGGDGQSVAGAGPETGGGGGAMGQNGAPGGNSANPVGGGLVPGGAGGQASNGCPLDTLVPLAGGSGGGQGGGELPAFGGQGGGGGGALQISSFASITIEKASGSAALLLAQGGGGAGGTASFGGGGGGAGGALLLEAARIKLVGATLAANGGAGGQGSGVQPGQNGQPSNDRAKGGGGNSDGHGGDGGAFAGLPTAGFSNGAVTFDGTGGGGGAVGRVRFNVKDLQQSGSIVVSPAPSKNLTPETQ